MIVMEIIYLPVICCIKLSILFTYIRIFPQPWLKKAVYGVMAFIAVYFITGFFGDLFQCYPISSWWELDESRHCINDGVFVMVNGVMNILTDIVMLVLPMPLVRQLQISENKKKSVLIIFLMGAV